jgi:hypothetical protein
MGSRRRAHAQPRARAGHQARPSRARRPPRRGRARRAAATPSTSSPTSPMTPPASNHNAPSTRSPGAGAPASRLSRSRSAATSARPASTSGTCSSAPPRGTRPGSSPSARGYPCSSRSYGTSCETRRTRSSRSSPDGDARDEERDDGPMRCSPRPPGSRRHRGAKRYRGVQDRRDHGPPRRAALGARPQRAIVSPSGAPRRRRAAGSLSRSPAAAASTPRRASRYIPA